LRSEAKESGNFEGEGTGSSTGASRILAARLGDSRATADLLIQLEGLLLPSARKLSLAHHDPVELVRTFIDDFLLNLPDCVVDESTLRRYARVAFRNRVRQLVRNAGVRERKYDSASESLGAQGETLVASSVSAYSRRATDPFSVSPDSSRPLRGLARALAAALPKQDRKLLQYLKRGVPPRKIAEWMGIEYGTCRVRIHRLRARLRKEALEYSRNATGTERASLDHFFARLGLAADDPGENND